MFMCGFDRSNFSFAIPYRLIVEIRKTQVPPW